MKLSVLALDYDGTFTRDDRPNASVLTAVADARRRNVTVILVTGRILDDLRRVAGDLRFVDGVVAENGAVIHFPGTGHTTILAPLSRKPLWRGSRNWAFHSAQDNAWSTRMRVLHTGCST